MINNIIQYNSNKKGIREMKKAKGIKRINISIPINLYMELKSLKANNIRINISGICQKAIQEKLDYIDNHIDSDSFLNRIAELKESISELKNIESHLKDNDISFLDTDNHTRINTDYIERIINSDSSLDS